jgi:methionyl-tRNA formyltransferase
MVTPLRVAFFGTPGFAVPSLRALLGSAHPVVAVVTQPDRPRGRGHNVRPGAVKLAALEAGLPILQPERLKEPSFRTALAAFAPDLGVVAAYGKLLPEDLLELPRLGLINVHASLLPRWRGAAPVHRAILAGDAETGVTIMRVVKALDAGPTIAAAPTPIGPDETSAELETRLSAIGAGLLVEAVDRLASGTATETPQDETAVTYARRLERGESQVDWARAAPAVHNQIRGLQPWPVAAAMLRGHRMLLLRSTVRDDAPRDETPGTICGVDSDGIDVATRPGAVRLLEIQMAGRAAMPTGAFLRGHALRPGEIFEPLPAP